MSAPIWRPVLYALKAEAKVSLPGVLIGTLVGAFVTTAIAAIELSKPPVTVLSAHELDGIAQRGGVLEMRYKFRRDQECNSVGASWLWRWQDVGNGEKIKYAVPIGTSHVTLADAAPGIQEFIIATVLPLSVGPGDWFLHQKFLDYCRLLAPVFGPIARTIPDVPIRIIAR